MRSYLIIDRIMIDDLVDQLLDGEQGAGDLDDWKDFPIECLPPHVRSRIDQQISNKMIAFLQAPRWNETSPYSPVAKHIYVFLIRYGIDPRHVVEVIFQERSIDLVLE